MTLSTPISPPLRIAILGAGAMGSLFGGKLHQGGAELTLIDTNQSHIDAINEHGLRLVTEAGEAILPIRGCRPVEAVGPFNLIIVFTKSKHVRQTHIDN